jgi:Flp pilus assembly pilin Flp
MLLVLRRFLQDESGQGITEYACILAFVCMLIVMVFGFSNGQLEASLSQTFSNLVGQFDRLSNEAAAHGT